MFCVEALVTRIKIFDYQELLSSYVAQNNELQVQTLQSEDLHQWNYKTVVTQDYSDVMVT